MFKEPYVTNPQASELFQTTPELDVEKKAVEVREKEDLVKRYMLFKEKERPKSDVVYHPCSGSDISPSVAFPESRVIYVETDKNVVEALKKKGLEAHFASATEFNPGKVDILILLNPVISPDDPSAHVVPGGFVLCNDYHGTASSLRTNDTYELRAIIRSKNKEILYDTENVEEYWEEIKTEEEFKNSPFSWDVVNYETAASVVEEITGKREKVLEEYKKIIDMAKEEQERKNSELLQKHPELAEMMGGLGDVGILIFEHEGKQFNLNTSLPRKKGTVDDIFVFQKKKKD